MDTGEALLRYGQLAATTARMVDLARQRHWALLPMLDAQCTDLFGQLREAPVDFSPSQYRRVQALARRIRRDQEVLNDLVRPHFVQLVRRICEDAASA